MPGEDGNYLVLRKVLQHHAATIFPVKTFPTASLVLLLSLLLVTCLWMPNILRCIQWITDFPGSQFLV